MKQINLNKDEPYVKLHTIANQLGVKYQTILDWTKRLDFPLIRLPGSIRVRPSEVVEWLQQFQSKNQQEVK